MVRRAVALAFLAGLLPGGHAMREFDVEAALDTDVRGQESTFTAESFMQLVEKGDLVMNVGDEEFGRSVQVHELNVTGPIFTHMVAAAAPVSTACSWWQGDRITPFYKTFAHLCGVGGSSTAALDAHIDRVWGLLRKAHDRLNTKNAPGGYGRTLKTFVSPEWTFRRYPEGVSDDDWVKPFGYTDLQYIIGELQDRFDKTIDDWYDWLIVPGSIYWGVSYTDRITNAEKWMVFNTLPVFHSGKLVYHHNKFAQADNMNKQHEFWGYDLVKTFPATSGCAKYGGSEQHICGTTKFLEWMETRYPGMPGFLAGMKKWGLKQPHAALIVNGLVVGVDICLDHSMTLGEGARSAERVGAVGLPFFDIQFLVSSGMAFIYPEDDGALSLHVRSGGVGLSADGVSGPLESGRLYVKKEGADGKWNASQGVVHVENVIVRGVRPGDIRAAKVTNKAKLAKDFVEKAAMLSGSWSGGCVDEKSKRYCNLCSTSRTQDRVYDIVFHQQLYPQEIQQFCQTEAGNWQLLKYWDTPIPLKEPVPEVSLKGYYKQIYRTPDYVTNAVASR